MLRWVPRAYLPAACLALCLSIGFFLHETALGQTARSSVAADQAGPIEQGDLVFRRGKGRWSPMFASANPTTGFSHVGVIDQGSDQMYVLHADADDDSWAGGVQRTPLAEFLQDSEFYEFRRNRMTIEEREAFMLALRQAWQEKVPFDTHFTLTDNGERFYCTEYVWWAANAAGITLATPIRIMGVDVITVDAIYASPVLSGL